VPRILVAPNAFKDSLSAPEAAQAIVAGLEASRLACACEAFPVGDGGDGTGALLVQRLGGEVRAAAVHDPLGRPIRASFGLVDAGRTAVVEMADAAGLRLLAPPERDPLRTTSFGAGELVAAALRAGAQRIVLCVGGSATVDGGCGLLQALGVRFLDGVGAPLTGLPASLADLAAIDAAGALPQLAECAFTVLCDVESPILGARGAARLYGPQKGASPAAVERLELALARYCEVIGRQSGREVAGLARGGAAGGVATGLFGLLGAELAPGAEHFLDAAGFDAALGRCDLVVTGEGRLDAQTLEGKAPAAVAARARGRGVPVVAIAGQVGSGAALRGGFDAVLSTARGPASLAEALAHAGADLRRTAMALGDLLALGARTRRNEGAGSG